MFRCIFRGRSENINRRGEGWGRKKKSIPASPLAGGRAGSACVAQWDDGETGYRDIYNKKKSGGNTLSIRVGSLQQTIITTL